MQIRKIKYLISKPTFSLEKFLRDDSDLKFHRKKIRIQPTPSLRAGNHFSYNSDFRLKQTTIKSRDSPRKSTETPRRNRPIPLPTNNLVDNFLLLLHDFFPLNEKQFVNVPKTYQNIFSISSGFLMR